MKFFEKGKQFITVPKYQNCFVYFLLKDRDVVYVGQTRNGLARPLSHRDKEFDEIKILYCAEADLDLLEDTYIQKYKPMYNKKNNYAIRWSLLRVRNCIRENIGLSDFTVPMLKRLLKELNIDTKIDYYTGRPSISFDEYRAVIEHLRSVKNGGK